MKVSIITTVKDDAKGFFQTMQSVKMQDHSNIEYVVVDASEREKLKDNCFEHLEKINVFIEGADSSPYEGMNRGIDAATGEIIALLHAGDVYCSNSIVSQVVEKIAENNIKLVYGNIIYHSADDVKKTVRVWKSAQIGSDSHKNGIFPPHTSLFIKKELYDQVGRYDLQYEIAADSDFMFRLFSQKPKSLYLQENILSMRVGGRSNRSIIAILRSNIEFCRMLRKHGVSHPFLKTLKKIFSKVGQLL